MGQMYHMKMDKDIKFIIEVLSTEIIMYLIEDYNWDIRKAFNQYYESETYQRLCDITTGLWYESSVYIYSYLKNEIETGICA